MYGATSMLGVPGSAGSHSRTASSAARNSPFLARPVTENSTGVVRVTPAPITPNRSSDLTRLSSLLRKSIRLPGSFESETRVEPLTTLESCEDRASSIALSILASRRPSSFLRPSK